MLQTYAVKVGNKVTIASGTFDDWKETFEVFKQEGISIETKRFSDYVGETMPCDQLLYFAVGGEDFPVDGPKWLF